MTIEEKKYKIFQIIERFHEREVNKLLRSLEQYQVNFETIEHLIKPTRATLNIEKLAKEQNYQGINLDTLIENIDALDIQESVEELIASK